VAPCHSISPDYPKPYRNLGVLFTDSGRFADAAIVLQTLARLEPDGARVHFDLGTACCAQARRPTRSNPSDAPSN